MACTIPWKAIDHGEPMWDLLTMVPYGKYQWFPRQLNMDMEQCTVTFLNTNNTLFIILTILAQGAIYSIRYLGFGVTKGR